MKKLKISLIALAAIVMGICGSAFTAPTAAPTGVGWFVYDGSGPLDDPLNYNYSGTTPPCSAHTQYCAMKGTQQASPNQSRPTQTSIDNASSASNVFTVEVAGVVIFKP